MKDYTKLLDDLFEKWKNEREFTHFYYDGLMYRGEYCYDKDNLPYWRKPGNESKMWDKCPTRVMFLLKDVNARGDTAEDDDDLRGRVFLNTGYRGYKNLTYWLYGILKTIETGHAPDYTFSSTEASKLFDETPVAYVNCKKQAGFSSCSYSTLLSYIERDKDFIIKEIDILNPDIIMCCAYTGNTGNPIFDFVKENIFTDLIKVNDWIYYSEKNNKVIIEAYHFVSRAKTNEYMYTKMTQHFEDFIKKYPKFKKLR